MLNHKYKGMFFKMFFKILNESHCVRLALLHLSYGWTNISHIIRHSGDLELHSIMTSEPKFTIITSLVIIGLCVWFTKYKLQYLLRTCLFIFFGSLCASYILPFFKIGKEEIRTSSSSCQRYSWSSVALMSGLMCFLMGFVRYRWSQPTNIIMNSSSVGFSHLKDIVSRRHRTIREQFGEIVRYRDPGQLNPIYVNGWIPLIESNAVCRGKVVTVVAIGYKFCVYRGEEGQVFVLDAYCPHMGADLSAGGQVKGNKIECPFHGWQFDGKTGKCSKIPYSNRVPDMARAKVWKSCEKNGYVFVWHHAEGDSPSWEVPSIPEIENGHWRYRGRSELTVYCHIQEIPENGADIFHLPQVHSRFVFLGPHLERSGPNGLLLQHDWQPQWAPDETENHIAKINLVQRLLLWGFEVPWTRIDASIKQIGPAVVHLDMQSHFGRGIFFQYITSEGPMQQKIVHILYTEPKFKQGPANFLMWGETVMIQRDIAVWNNKKFLKNPLLIREDKLISKFRRWYAQFYSEHSPTLKDIRQRTLEW